MLASAVIIGLSAVLLAYWFRYTCLLLLKDGSHAASEPNESLSCFGFPAVQRSLQGAAELGPLASALERDYKVLAYLVDHTPSLGSIEDRLLVLDYRLMQWQYRLTKTWRPRAARKSLSEMAAVLETLVRKIPANASAGAFTNA